MIRFVATILVLARAAGSTSAADPGIEFFEAKIRPVLVENCYKCHSTAAKKQQGGLHLDTRDAIRKGGDTAPAVVPGKPADSLLLMAVRQTGELKMPPEGQLSKTAIADLEKWIAMGAPDPRDVATAGKPISIEEGRKFWSFQPLRRPAVPDLANRRRQPPGDGRGPAETNHHPAADAAGSPIDDFIRAKLAEKGVRPNPPADRRTLIRRVYFDVIGLPPTPEEVDAFVNDPDPAAYAKLVDRLLASPHYGERWGRHWLDVARFGESSGYEHDNDRPHAYQYRDFVIQALNRDVPFDKFVRWQVAGDRLEPENPLAVKATGFLAAGTMNGQVTEREVEPARYEVFDDWVGTIGTGFLGLTVGCARCHDHKYDPIPTRDYYNLAANFTNAVRANVSVPRDPAQAQLVTYNFKGWYGRLIREMDAYERYIAPPKAETWRSTHPTPPAIWIELPSAEVSVARSGYAQSAGQALKRQPDGSYLFTHVNGEIGPIVVIARTPLTDVRAIRIEALTDDSLPNRGPGLGDNGNFTINNVTLTVRPLNSKDKPQPVKLTLARATTGATGGHWSVDSAHAGRDQAAVYAFEKPAGFESGTNFELKMTFPGDSTVGRQSIGRFRLSLCVGEQPKDIEATAIAHDDYVEAQRALADDKPAPAVTALYCRTDAEWLKRDAALRKTRKVMAVPPYDTALVVTEGVTPLRMMSQGPDLFDKTFVLKRGDVDKKDGEATPGVLQVLSQNDRSQTPDVHPRIRLANWLTDVNRGAGSLVARVIVNRLWQHHMGHGIVGTPSDFGAQGDRPTHPELLDWLASELIAHGWSLKAIHREILLSATYQQSAIRNPQSEMVDPDNRLWWRRPLVRLDAEVIRDAMLAVSGRLDPRPFGPGSLDEGMTRRSIYFTVKRSALIPSMVQFDWPETLQGVGQRVTTTVAPQALLMLNSPHVRADAAAFAAQLRSLADPVTIVYERALGRPPTATERSAAGAFVDIRRNESDGNLTYFCQALFALNEFLYVK